MEKIHTADTARRLDELATLLELSARLKDPTSRMFKVAAELRQLAEQIDGDVAPEDRCKPCHGTGKTKSYYRGDTMLCSFCGGTGKRHSDGTGGK